MGSRGAWWWIDRWRKSSGYLKLTLAEQGAYRNLLDELWLRDGVLENDERYLANACGDAKAWPKVRDKVLAHFALTDRGWTHSTHEEVRVQSDKFTRSQIDKGRARAAKAVRDESGRLQPDVQPKPSRASSHEPAISPADSPASENREQTYSSSLRSEVSSSPLPAEREAEPTGPSPEAVAELWGSLCPMLTQPDLPLAAGVRDSLRKALKRERGRDWTATFRRIAASPKLTGREFDWKCPGILWAVGPKNLAKLDAGEHDEQVTNPKPRGWQQAFGVAAQNAAALEQVRANVAREPDPQEEPTPW